MRRISTENRNTKELQTLRRGSASHNHLIEKLAGGGTTRGDRESRYRREPGLRRKGENVPGTDKRVDNSKKISPSPEVHKGLKSSLLSEYSAHVSKVARNPFESPKNLVRTGKGSR